MRWFLLPLAFLAMAVAATGLFALQSDPTPASASHDRELVIKAQHLREDDANAGWVQVGFNKPMGLYGVFTFKVNLTPANGASWDDINIQGAATREFTVYGYGNDYRNINKGFVINETGTHSGNTTIKNVRIPIRGKQDQDLDPNEQVGIRIYDLHYHDTDQNLEGNDFNLHIKAFNIHNSSLTIIDDEAKPSVPGNLQATAIGPDSVRLTWEASDGGRINGQNRVPSYHLEMDGAWGGNHARGGSSHIVSGLNTVENAYTFRIRAFSDVGESYWTDYVSSARYQPDTPGNVRATSVGPGSVRVTWESSGGGWVNGQQAPNPDYYDVTVRERQSDAILRGTRIVGHNTSYTVTGLDTYNKRYEFRVSALVSGARSEYSDWVASETFRPGTPANLTATTIGPNSVLLRWEAQGAGVGSDGQPITPRYQYDVEGIGWRDVPGTGATSHVVGGLDTANNTYRFRISALSGNARSWWTGYVASDVWTGPDIASVEITSDPGSDTTYAFGDRIEVAVRFNEEVTVVGNPQLQLDFGTARRTARYSAYGAFANKIESGARHQVSTMYFAYDVTEVDVASNGIALPAHSLSLNGGSVTNGAGAVNLSYAAVAADPGHKVDGVRPVFGFAAVPEDGGSVILYFSEVIGLPPLVTDLSDVLKTPLWLFYTGVLDLTADGRAVQPSGANAANGTIVLQLSEENRIGQGQQVAVAYDNLFATDSIGLFVDGAGNPLLNFGAKRVNNQSTVGIPPAGGPSGSLTFSSTEISVRRGQSQSYTVRLAAQPNADVTVTLGSAIGTLTYDEDAGAYVVDGGLRVSANQLVFTADNWNQPQTVTLTAPAQSTHRHWVLLHTAASADSAFDGLQTMSRVLIPRGQ